MRTRLILATVPVALLSMAAASSSAAPKKKKPPITKSYTATASADPVVNAEAACADGLPNIGEHVEAFKVPAPGRLEVTMTGFQGDWDLCLRDKDGATIASSTGFLDATTEAVSVKFKKPVEITIVSQNLSGTATAAMKYTFTYN